MAVPVGDGLLDRWYPRLLRFARARLGDTHDAEDVVQEAFARLAQLPDSPPRHTPAWLLTVTRNLVRDRERRRAVEDRARDSYSVTDAPQSNNPEDEFLAGERATTVHRTLDALSPRDRSLLLLHHSDVPYAEIAIRLGVSAGSVGPLLTRAHRRFLREYHSRRGVGGADLEAP